MQTLGSITALVALLFICYSFYHFALRDTKAEH